MPLRLLVRLLFPEVPRISTAELETELAGPDPPLLLDVRTATEFEVSHLPGARRVDPAPDSPPLLAGRSPAAPVVVYCAVGYRSAAFARALRRRGFGDLRNLDGSLFQWAAEGRPLAGPGGAAAAVHPYDRFGAWLLRRLGVPAAELPPGDR